MRRLKELHRHSRRSLIRSTIIDALEGRRLLAAPAISAAASVVVPVGKTLQVPLAGSDADGQVLSYAVGSAKGVTASFRSTTNSWLELNTSKGAMNFQLFDDLAPNTVRKIRGLVQSGFYDGLNFHQLVVDASSGYRFAIGGDPKGDGTGGPDFRFDDEFHKDAVFSGTGQLAMVNGQIKDNNGSQFFVTDAPARRYDFNYTIFGQLVRGDAALDSILAAPVDSNQKPRTPIVINSARIVENKTDAVLQLRGGSATTATSITVSATDPDGNRSYKTINVTVNNDGTNANTPPILAPLSPVIVAVPGERFTLPLQAIDLENNTWEIGGTILSGGEGLAYKLQDTSNQRFVFEVKEGYTGAIQIRVGVRETGAVSRGNIDWMPSDVSQALRIYDTQVITIAAGDRPISAEPLTIASYPNIQLREKLLVQFSSQDLDLNKSDFDAVIDWGDGEVVEDADIDEINDGLFGVYGTHTFARSGNMPLSVRIESRNGFVKTVDSTIYINDPFALNGSTLTVRGTDEDDEVELKVEGATLRAQIGSYSRVYDRAAISLLDIQLFDGDDLLDSGTDVGMPNQRIDAGAGNDTIYAGSGHDYVVAGNGHDIVNGNGGNDTLIGGSGNDSLLSGSGKNFCYGDDGNDRITGSGGRDYFEGGADSDRLYGRGGDDYLDGGGGTDRLYGEDGNDTLIGGSSNDRIYGGVGDDVFWGKQGVDYLTGGGGNDRRGDNDPTDVLFDF